MSVLLDNLTEWNRHKEMFEAGFKSHLSALISDVQFLESCNTEEVNNGARPVCFINFTEGASNAQISKPAACSQYPEETSFVAQISFTIITPLKQSKRVNAVVAKVRAAMMRAILLQSENFRVAEKGFQVSYPTFAGRTDDVSDVGFRTDLEYNFNYYYVGNFIFNNE